VGGIQDVRFPFPSSISLAPLFPELQLYLTLLSFTKTLDAEALQVTYDPSLVTYRQLLEFFFRMHDPTTMNRQGPDVGTQYRSAIFTHGDEQQKTAEGVAEKVAAQWYKQPLSTQIVPAGPWWDAEEYHQLYLNKNPAGYECPAQYVVPFSSCEKQADC